MMDGTDRYLAPYLYLRRAIGVIGLALPFALLAGSPLLAGPAPGSISGYYHSELRDVLVGTLCAIGVFLLAYRFDSDGDDLVSDNRLTNAAGAAAVAVALFPTSATDAPITWVAVVHGCAAVVFFALLAYLSAFRFTRPDPGTALDAAKRRRNTVYRVCGAVIAVTLVVALADALLGEPGSRLFWEETVMVLAFAVSWLVKGHVLGGATPTGDAAASPAPVVGQA